MRMLGAVFLATCLVTTGAFGSSLSPGKPAGIKQAQLMNPYALGIAIAAGAAAVAALAIGLSASNNNMTPTPTVTTSTSTST